MLINGYEDSPLVAGEELLALPGFWAAHLMWLCQTEEDEYVTRSYGRGFRSTRPRG
ncbi:MAG TPA: hypothetical protein VIU94_07615 [Streptomyces sp.]